MSTLLQLGQVPSSEVVDFLRDVAATMWVPMDIIPAESLRREFAGEFRASDMGPMQVVAIDVPPATVTRGRGHICEADPDMLKLLLLRSGDSCVLEQNGRQAKLTPGDFVVYDTRRPYQAIIGTGQARQLEMMTFMFPASLLPIPRNRIRELTALRFGAGAGLGAVTSQFLQQLARNVDHYSPAEAARLSAVALEMLATRLVRQLDFGDWQAPEARRHAMLTTIQSFIQEHLTDSGLSPTVIAAAHHMSLRSLHQLFHDEGLTVAGWIRQRRLERCRRDLSDPALATRPVAAIAARWGFSSPGDFSRVFRAVHGLPPAEYRMSALAVKGPAL